MAENQSQVRAERVNISPIEVSYELKGGENSALFKINGQALAEAMAKTGYRSTSISSVIISDRTAIPGEMAKFNPLNKSVQVDHEEIIRELASIRGGVYGYIDGIQQQSKLKRVLNIVGGYLHPLQAPYMTLRNYGQPHRFSGDRDRKESYLKAAIAGFPDSVTGQPRLSKEEATDRAKHFVDELLERATPGIIGWILAHEIKHGDKFKRKLGLKAVLSLAPFASSVAALSAVPQLANEDGLILVAGLVASYSGSVLGRRIDEKASYDAGDADFAKFAKAVSTNSFVFQEKVLGKQVNAKRGEK